MLYRQNRGTLHKHICNIDTWILFRYLRFKKTILLDRKAIVDLVDLYRAGSISWEEFSSEMKEAHADKMGNPAKRLVIPGKPKEEDYFYTNPEECLARVDEQLPQVSDDQQQDAEAEPWS